MAPNSAYERMIREVKHGDHLCSIYQNHEQQMQMVLPFLKMGLERGEKCLYIADENTRASILKAMRSHGIKPRSYLEQRQLIFLTKNETYLKDDFFDPDRMIVLLEQSLEEALQQGYAGLRITGEMTWVLEHLPGVEQLLEYESKLNTFFPGRKVTAICQYNEARFEPKLLLEIIRTHPLVIVGDMVCENFYYIPPEEFLPTENTVTRQAYRRSVEHLLKRARLVQETKNQRNVFEQLLESISDGFLALDEDLTVTYFNSGAECIFHRKREDVVGQKLFDSFPETRNSIFEKNYCRAIHEKIPLTFETQFNVPPYQGYYQVKISPRVHGIIVLLQEVSERKRVEKALQESEEKYRNLVEQSPDGIFSVDLRGNFLSVNRTICDQLGYTREELLSMNIWDIVPSKYQSHFKKRLEQIIKGERLDFPVEYEVVTKTGKCYTVEVRSAPLIKDGQVVGFQGIARDITEMKQAEKVRRQLQETIDQSFEGFAFWDENGICQYMNDAHARMFGYSSPKECIGKFYGDVVLPRISREEFEKFKQEVLIKKRHYYGPWPSQTVQGKKFDVEINLTSLFEGGEYKGHICRALDITERKRAEEALRESEERYRTLIENMPIVCFTFDRHGRILSWNRAAEQVYGYTKQEAVGASAYDLIVTPMTKEATDQVIKRVFAGESIVGSEWQDRNKKGEVGWRMGNTFPLFRTDGSVECGVNLNIDITSQKRAAMALQESEEWLRFIFDGSLDAIFIAGADARFVDVNEAASALTGYSREELKKMSIPDLHDPEDLHAYRAYFDRIMAGEAITSEARIRKKDGTKIDVEFSNKRIMIGDIPYMHTVARDITERRRAEEALRESEERYRTVVENANDAIYILSGTHFAYVNPRFEELLGYKAEEICVNNFNFMNLVAPESQEFIAQRAEARKRGEKIPSRYEFKVLTKSGEIRQVEVNTVSLGLPGEVRVMGILRDITERKAVEAELRQWAFLVESVHEFITVTDLEGRITYVNPAVLQRFGYSLDELKGQWARIFFSPRNAPSLIKEIYSKTLKNGGWRGEVINQTKEGEEFYIDLSTALITEEGKPVAMVAISHDITEHKQAEQALRASEERLRALFENVPEAVFVFDAKTYRVKEVNRIAVERYGYSREEFLSMSILDFRPKEDIPKTRATIDGHEPAGAERLGVFRHRKKDGTIFPVEIHRQVLDTPTGPQIVAIAVDLTERMRAEEALRESEEKYRTLFNQIADPIFVFDSETKRFLDANNKAIQRYGYSLDELREMTPFDLHPPDESDTVRENIDDRSDKRPHTYRHLTRSGQYMDVEIHTEEIEYHGRPAWISIVRDITERRRLEAQLRQAQKMEAIGQLAGGIAHDFNNLLTGILGYSELLLMEIEPTQTGYEELTQIKNVSLRARALVQNLLTFSRRAESHPRPLNLNHEIQSVRKLLERTIPKTIEIRLHLAENLKIIYADPSQMHQVLINLAINARDAMPDGGELTIETENVILDKEYCRTHLGAKPGHCVLLTVSDTGCGMDSETQNRVFEPFFTTKEMGKGTGLGLAMVYGIVKSHQGYITVYSEPNQGTTFKIYLPVLESLVNESQAEIDTEFTGGNETVLLVDDEEIVGALGKRFLEKYGYRVLLASNGHEALKIYKKQGSTIDLVILDLIMPQMDGKTCFLELQKLNPKVKVLLSSGYSVNGPARQILKSGAKGFVKKPYEVKQLLKSVRKALDAR